ncbi:uncharacterized protein BKA78DRAFT_303931 [Phyllosticta capitalensis]|uniref:uncharacterized protein n=1 Tax=Phyllosticta capitalensis TaxID=121624 RepID=UPI00312ED78E
MIAMCCQRCSPPPSIFPQQLGIYQKSLILTSSSQSSILSSLASLTPTSSIPHQHPHPHRSSYFSSPYAYRHSVTHAYPCM